MNARERTDGHGIGEELTHSDLKTLEYLLKGRMAKRFGAIQAGRANNETGHSIGSARKYVEEARTLRRLLKERGRQGYVPLRDIDGTDDWVPDRQAERAGIDSLDSVKEAAEKIHAAGLIPTEHRRTLTDHDKVPGTPGSDKPTDGGD